MNHSFLNIINLGLIHLFSLLFFLLTNAYGDVHTQEKIRSSSSAPTVVSASSLNVSSEGLPYLVHNNWVKTSVVVEIFIQHEIEREVVVDMGLVIDNQGHIVIRSEAFANWIPSQRIQEIRVYPFGIDTHGDGFKAQFIAKDTKLGWKYIQVEQSCWSFLKPITEFPIAQPQPGQTLYSFFHLDKDFNFAAFLGSGSLGTSVQTPFNIGILMDARFGLGSSVFTDKGEFVGWTINSSPFSYIMIVGSTTYPISLLSRNLGNQVLLASSLMELLTVNPEKIDYSTRPWLGLVGTIPLDHEAAQLLGLNQGAISISNIVSGSPVDKAGIKERDILLAIDGKPLINHASKAVVENDFRSMIWSHKPGDILTLTVLRSNEKLNIPVTLGKEPKNESEATYKYFPKLGLTVREFLVTDNIEMQQLNLDLTGVRVTFIKQNSPAFTAGVRPGDWLLEIDSKPIQTFTDAVDILSKVSENTTDQKVAVLLVKRDNQTHVLQVKLD